MHTPAPWTRCLLVWLAVTAGCLGTVAWLWPAVTGPRSTFADLLTVTCALAGTCCAGWLWAVTTLTTMAAARGSATAPASRGVRRLVLTACGVALVAGTTAPAHAVTGTIHEHHRDRDAAVRAVQGLPLPELPDTVPTRVPAPAPIDGSGFMAPGRSHSTPESGTSSRPVDPPHDDPASGRPSPPTPPTVQTPSPQPSPAESLTASRRSGAGPRPRNAHPIQTIRATSRTVVVREGDSLWSLAAASLPPHVSDDAIAERWQRIYALNLDLIGSDPDLIEPGQVLALPLSEG